MSLKEIQDRYYKFGKPMPTYLEDKVKSLTYILKTIAFGELERSDEA